ncbi:hypothetical protein Agub_g2046, partial [Astrephomene gubernaculifera]
HGGAAAVDAGASHCGPLPIPAVGVHLQQLVWAAARCLALRASPLDARLRPLMVDAAASSQARIAALLAGAGNAADTGAAAQLTALAAALLRGVVAHPLSEQLSQATCATAAAAGMPGELQQLQPLDVRYSHLLQPYLPGVQATEWAAVEARAARLRCAVAALGARLLMQHVTAGADAAVATGMASPMQVSYWRFLRPEERAATDAEHPVVDCCYPLLAALAELEEQLLQPSLLPDTAWQDAELEPLLAAVQQWRGALWRTSHGLLHLPLSVQPQQQEGGVAAAGAAAVACVVQQVHQLDVPQLTWTWMRADKALTALLSHAVVAEALSSDAASGGVAARLEYLRAQTRDALGLSSRPAKPLAWRLCGKPVLPSTLSLLGAMVEGRALASASAAAAVDPQGRPMGLQAAGVDLDALILAAAAEAAASAGSTEDASAMVGAVSGRAGSVEELLGEEAPAVRQHVAEAVALVLCVDPALRRAVGQGVAMLGAMPLLEALRPGAAGAGAAVAAGEEQHRQSLAAQGASVVSALRGSLRGRVQETVAQVLACPSEDEWMMRQGVKEVQAGAAAPAAGAREAQLPLLLPSAWMT